MSAQKITRIVAIAVVTSVAALIPDPEPRGGFGIGVSAQRRTPCDEGVRGVTRALQVTSARLRPRTSREIVVGSKDSL